MLVGCSSTPAPVVKTVTVSKPVYVLPPSNMMATGCPLRPFNGTTNLDLHRYTLQLITDIKICNQEFLRLRQWRQSVERGASQAQPRN
ncbi:Rz1-like lysis system protein LysC [Rheinheimera tilapiae]|uniref:Uncharacterized protein n=1 Tax=Rheinheimera tilapiae TaxID=875043 RepID=A0ABV6BAD9_9GAMM